MKNAYLAGGCFWCIASFISNLNGVCDVVSGYSGGDEVNPTYEEVKRQETNHRETIKILYDENIISYKELVEFFIDSVDPFDDGGQFIDRGHSYTLAIYYDNEEEKEEAIKQIRKLEEKSKKRVYIGIERFKTFYEAEEYHQKYHLKNPEAFKEELEKSGRKK